MRVLQVSCCLWLLLTVGIVEAADAPNAWKAGFARAKITPRSSMWMAGYAARNRPSEGVAQDLFAKVVALQNAQGKRVVMVTTDLIGIPRTLRDAIEVEANRRFQLPRHALLLNASHTHCGPELRNSRLPPGSDERQKQSTAYVAELQETILTSIGAALADLQPARLDYQSARCGFAMNRRLPRTDGSYANSPNRDGPVDHHVPVLRVTSLDGALRGVVFGYACHNTTLGFYMFCGDYAGFAQEYIESRHPGAVAMFMMGCAGDQNPYPRRQFDHAQQHGRSLANAVEAALETAARPIGPELRTEYDEAVLDFAPPPSREQLVLTAAEGKEPYRGHAERLLKQLQETGTIRDTYSYPVQVIALDDDVLLVALAGEVVVDYALRLRRELPSHNVWVAGYSNDVFGYVPSLRVLQEGGYEAGGAMYYGSLPGPFAPSVEEKIIRKVLDLVNKSPETR